MIAALDTANKPKHNYKEEVFTILASNAFELLFKAKWLADHNNDPRTLYVKQARQKKDGKPSKLQTYRIGRSGNPVTHEASYLLSKIDNKIGGLDQNIRTNFQLLLESRDNSIHFYSPTATIEKVIREVGLASIKNYLILVKKWFDIEPEELSNVLVPLGVLDKGYDVVFGNKEEERFINFVLKQARSQSDSEYSVAMKIDVKMTKSDNPGAVPIRNSKDGPVVMIQMSEEDIRSKFPWTHKDLIEKLKARYKDIKQDSQFNEIKKEIMKNDNISHTRFLNPKNTKSSKITFYNSNAFQIFDKHYEKK